jgi:hypothetical protein
MAKKKKIPVPEIGTTCPALSKENYDYMLSGDCEEFCICSVNGHKCAGRTIEDPLDYSSQFFSRGMCNIDFEKIKRCPLYGVSKETFALIVKDRMEKELNEKLKLINK